MTARLVIFVLVLGMHLKGFSEIPSANLDTLIHKRIDHLVQRFNFLVGLTDEKGNYHISIEKQFEQLFAANATIYNFLPQTPNQGQYIPIAEYIKHGRYLNKNHIIRPGHMQEFFADFVSYERKSGIYRFDVIIPQEIQIFDRNSFQHLEKHIANLILHIALPVNGQPARIERVVNQNERFVDLTFRVLYPERNPGQHIPFEIRYKTNRGETIQRNRNTGGKGIISISNLPENAILDISPSNGSKLLLPVNITAGQWAGINDTDRFLIVRPPIIRSRERGRNLISVGSTLPFIHQLSYTLPGDQMIRPPGVATRYAESTRFYAGYSRLIKLSEKFDIITGLSFEYERYGFNSSITVPMFAADPATDACNDCSPAGFIWKEHYLAEQYKIPFSLGINYTTGYNFLRFADLRASLMYAMPHSYSYHGFYIFAGNEVFRPTNSNGILKEGEEPLPPATDIHTNSIKANMDMPARIIPGMEFSMHFNLFRNQLFLRYHMGYQFRHTGNSSETGSYSAELPSGLVFFQPTLTLKEFTSGVIITGLGLSFNF